MTTPAASLQPYKGLAWTDWALLVAVNLVWSLNIVFVKLSVDAVPPMTAAFLRQLIFGLLCLPFIRIVPGKMRIILSIAAISGGMFYMLTNFALANAENVAAVAIVGQLSAPFSVILSVIFLGERIGLPRIAGIAMAFVGVLLVGFDPRIIHEGFGLLLNGLAALVWAIGSILTRRVSDVPVRTLFAWIGLVGSITMALLSLIFEPGAMATVPDLAPDTFGAIAFSAIGSTLIGHGGFSWLVQRHPINVVIPYTLVSPLLAVVFSALAFGAPVTALAVFGGIVTLAGVTILTLRSAKKGLVVEESA